MERATFKMLDEIAEEAAALLNQRVRVDHAFKRLYVGGTAEGGGSQVSPTGLTVTELYRWMLAWRTGIRTALLPKVDVTTPAGRFVEETAQAARRQGLNVFVAAERDGTFAHRTAVESDNGRVVAAFNRIERAAREATNPQ